MLLFALASIASLITGLRSFENCSRHSDCMLGENCWRGQCQCTAYTDQEHFGCIEPGYGCKHFDDLPNECLLTSPTQRPTDAVQCDLSYQKECLSNDCHFVSFPMNGHCECNFRSDCDMLSYCDKTAKINECQILENILYAQNSSLRPDVYAPYYLLRGWDLTSKNGKFRAAMQNDLNFVIYDQFRQVFWATMSNNWAVRTGDGFAGILMTKDGNVILIDAANKTAWSTNTAGCGRYMILQNDGSLVVYGNKQQICWISTSRSFLKLNSKLVKGQKFSSPRGYSIAQMQLDGNFVITLNSKIVFQTYTQDVGEYVWMQSDGNLVIYDYFNIPVWATNTYNMSILQAHLLDDGNLILEDRRYVPKWAARGMLFAGKQLNKGEEIRSLDMKSGAVMQSDGNFVVYKKRVAVFSTDTVGKGSFVIMQKDGNFVLYDERRVVLWSTRTHGYGNYVVMQDDGNFKVLDEFMQVRWSIF